MQSGDGSRSSTPGTAVDGRVMFPSHPSPLSSQSLAASSYPSISSPSLSVSSGGSLGHTLFTGTKYLSSTPPEAHRYMSDTYRVTSSEPIDQSRYLVDTNRMSVDPYRQQTPETHRISSDLERLRAEDQNIETSYHRSAEDIYQNNNPIDLQRVQNAQRIVSDLHRMHSDSQRIVDDLRSSAMSSESLQRHEIHNSSNHNSNSPTAQPQQTSLNYRTVLAEPIRSPSEHAPPPQRIIQDSMNRSHPDPQRLVQESFRDYFSASQRQQVIDNARVHGDARLISVENLRYISSESLRSDTQQRYTVNIPPERGMIAENLRLGNDSSHALVAENLRIGSETPHTMMPENLRVGGAETPHTMIAENLRVTPESSRMVPENLCLTEPSHQVMPENLRISHDSVVNGRQGMPNSSNGDITNSRMMSHSQQSASAADSPMPLMRTHYDPSSHKMIAESSHALRVQSPHYTDTIYRNDIHSNIGPHAPPTPAPSVPPPMPEQVSTPLPQYYSSYTSHSTPADHNNHYPAYMNDTCEERDGMSLEEKIERGYQDIKPFDQDYPVSLPMMHMSQDVLPPPPPVPKPPKPKKPKEPKPPRMPIVHKCNECLRVFKNSTQLKNHMWRHTGEKPFTCDECGSKFTQQGNLRAHRRIHTGERPYQCSECKACFTQLSTLKTHQKIHSDERPYKCNECDAAFRQVANLKTHQVTHTGERPHKCDQCDKAFTQKSNLKAHKNRVHYGEGISVPAKRGRKKNPVAIKPFSCLECGAKFTVLSNLKIHAKLHTGDKPFECDHCGAGFAQRSNLKTHIQRMHGRVPGQTKRRFKCDECPAMFRLRRCLKTHKKRRHPIKSLKIKILRESKYHLNSAEVVEGGEEEEDDDDEKEDEDDIDEGDDEGDDEDDDDDGSEDRESLDSKAALSTHPSKSFGEADDVYESGFNSTDEEAIGDYRSRDRDRIASVAEPIVQIREPKVERIESPHVAEDSPQGPMLMGRLDAKQEAFEDVPLPLGLRGNHYHRPEAMNDDDEPPGGLQNDERRQLAPQLQVDNVYMGSGRGGEDGSLNCAEEDVVQDRDLPPSTFESKNLSIELSGGS